MKLNKKYFIKTLFLVLAVSLAHENSFAGGETGNGGGGLLINGVFKTFGEMGVQLETKTQDGRPYSPITPEIRDELNKILDPNFLQIPHLLAVQLKETVFVSHAGSSNPVYRQVVVLDPVKFASIASDYKMTIKDKSLFENGEFKLFAVSKNGETDIYPDFENLNTKQKALILIHEALFRRFPNATLAQVLSVDIALNKLLEKKPGLGDPTELHLALNKIGMIRDTQVLVSFLRYLKTTTRGANDYFFNFSNIGGEYFLGIRTVGYEPPLYSQHLLFDDEKVKNFSHLHPNFKEIFFGKALYFHYKSFRVHTNVDYENIPSVYLKERPRDWILVGCNNGLLLAMDWREVYNKPKCLQADAVNLSGCGEILTLELERTSFAELSSFYNETYSDFENARIK
jgi:hypothetical protein